MEASWPEIIDLTVKILGVLGGIFSFLLMAVVLIMRKSFVTREAFDEHKTEHAQHIGNLTERLNHGENRFTRLEDRFNQIPNKDDLHQVANSLTRVDGKVDAVGRDVHGLGEQLTSLAATVQMLVNNELGNGNS